MILEDIIGWIIYAVIAFLLYPYIRRRLNADYTKTVVQTLLKKPRKISKIKKPKIIRQLQEIFAVLFWPISIGYFIVYDPEVEKWIKSQID